MSDATDALESLVPPGMKPKDKLGGYWFKVSVIALLFCGLIGQVAFKMWIETNYISTSSNSAAWEKQVQINTRLSEQLGTLNQSDSISVEIDRRQDKQLDALEKDIREQRAIIYSHQ